MAGFPQKYIDTDYSVFPPDKCCRACGEIKPSTDFYLRIQGTYKTLSSECKCCYNKATVAKRKQLKDGTYVKSLTKLECVKNGIPAKCRIHGTHSEWRIYNGNNVRCQLCDREQEKKFRRENPIKAAFVGVKQRCKESGLPCDIDLNFLEELIEKQGNRCALTGLMFDNVNFRPSVDRIDSSQGYLKSNVQWVIFEANRMKTDFSLDSFLEYCRLVVSNSDPVYGLSGC